MSCPPSLPPRPWSLHHLKHKSARYTLYTARFWCDRRRRRAGHNSTGATPGPLSSAASPWPCDGQRYGASTVRSVTHLPGLALELLHRSASACSRTSFSLVAATRRYQWLSSIFTSSSGVSPLWHPPSSPVSLILVAVPVEDEPQLRAGPQHTDGFLLNSACAVSLRRGGCTGLPGTGDPSLVYRG